MKKISVVCFASIILFASCSNKRTVAPTLSDESNTDISVQSGKNLQETEREESLEDYSSAISHDDDIGPVAHFVARVSAKHTVEVYEEPYSRQKVVATWENGTEIVVMLSTSEDEKLDGKNGIWYYAKEIAENGSTGWIFSAFMEREK